MEEEALDELCARHGAELDTLRSRLSLECEGAVPDDLWLLRFLVNSNASKAEGRVKAMLAWRNKHNVDAIAHNIISKGMQPKDFPHYAAVCKHFPQTTLFSFTEGGSPFSVDRYGSIDIQGLLSSVTAEQYYEFNLYRLEFMRLVLDRLSRQRGRLVRWWTVADLAGLGMQHMNKTFLGYLKRVSQDSQDHYRECAGTVLCVNCGSVFTLFWRIVRAVLSERTAAKVQILGTSFHREVHRYIPSSRLPAHLAGDLDDTHWAPFAVEEECVGPPSSGASLPPLPSASPSPSSLAPSTPCRQPSSGSRGATLPLPVAEDEGNVSASSHGSRLSRFRRRPRSKATSNSSPRPHIQLAPIVPRHCPSLGEVLSVMGAGYRTPPPASVGGASDGDGEGEGEGEEIRPHLVASQGHRAPGVFSVDERLNAQLSGSGGAVYAVTRHSSGPLGERVPRSARRGGVREVGVVCEERDHLPKTKMRHLDFAYVAWVGLFAGLLLNSGAISPRFQLAVSVELPLLISFLLWVVLMLVPLGLRYAYRRQMKHDRLLQRAIVRRINEHNEIANDEWQTRYHQLVMQRLEGLCTDLGGVAKQVQNARLGPNLFVKHPTNRADEIQRRRAVSNAEIDRVVQLAGEIRARSSHPTPTFASVRADPSARHLDHSGIEMANVLGRVRHEIGELVLLSANLARDLNEATRFGVHPAPGPGLVPGPKGRFVGPSSGGGSSSTGGSDHEFCPAPRVAARVKPHRAASDEEDAEAVGASSPGPQDPARRRATVV